MVGTYSTPNGPHKRPISLGIFVGRAIITGGQNMTAEILKFPTPAWRPLTVALAFDRPEQLDAFLKLKTLASEDANIKAAVSMLYSTVDRSVLVELDKHLCTYTRARGVK